MNDDIRVLCFKCADHYRQAGFTLIRVKNQQVKQECDICHRFGWEYVIEENKGEQHEH